MTLLLDDNSTLTKFIAGVAIGNKKTAFDYRIRLETFRVFVLEKYKMSLDELILIFCYGATATVVLMKGII